VKAESRHSGQLGFTLVELTIFLVLAGFIAAGFLQVLRYQQRAYRHERATVARHDALRLAGSVLAADLMEANGTDGDFAALGPDSITVRSPVGFGIICATDPSGKTLGLIDLTGRISAAADDSVLIYRPDGWLVRAPAEVNPASSSLTCPYGDGFAPEAILRVAGSSIDSVPVGAPLRAFHSYTYRLVQEGSSWWLARDDGTVAEVLAGPFSGDSLGLAFSYFDTSGQPTVDPALVARVDLNMVAVSGAASARRDTLVASVRPRNQ
jgi:type II secretory pathway pseudopilin PulG